MNKSILFGGALAVALSAAPAMAGDCHALGGLQGTAPAALDDKALATTEGGAACALGTITADSQGDGGVCLLSLIAHPSGAQVGFSVTNALPVTGANFLSVTGF
jgi:hypothetical protein